MGFMCLSGQALLLVGQKNGLSPAPLEQGGSARTGAGVLAEIPGELSCHKALKLKQLPESEGMELL